MKTKVAVVGATGYTGEEITDLLAGHGNVEITSLTAIVDKADKFSNMYPRFRGVVDIICKELDVNEVAALAEVIFLALPHRVSMQYAPKFLDAGRKVIDLSADYRLDPETYASWYGARQSDAQNLSRAVYGLPEFFRAKIKDACLIANPGCYPTSVILAAAPAVISGMAAGEIIADSKSGVTGAGRKASIGLLFGEVAENLKAYKINEHQHMPEMADVLKAVSGRDVALNFVPHLIPMRRGILSTVYIPLAKGVGEKDIFAKYREFYGDEPFVRLYEPGRLPEIKDVVNTNFCDIGLCAKGGLLIVVACIDNLLKGAAGQAVQNMNIMCGFDEKEGLI
ncbi:MAG: N-acetyl-gamma-glutamyl-phosphate reductase [Candidatus Omnitrophota bacterium]